MAQLVIDDIKDGTGDAVLKDRISGLSQEFREHVARDLQWLAAEVARTLSLARLTGVRLSRQPLSPRSTVDVTAKSLAESVSTLTSDQTKSALTFLSQLLLRPRGTKVVATARRRGTSPDRVGISFTIADLRDEGAPEGLTVWEAPVAATAGRARRGATPGGTTPEPDGGAQGSDTSRAEALRAVARHLENVGLLEEAITHLRDALGPRRPWTASPSQQ